jgi:antitoxin (DNA-binding transcriptional repressor) of toxin-antitoxin stability system
MQTMTVNVAELPGRLSELLAKAAEGAEVLVTDGEVVGKLVPPANPATPPPAGRREWKLGLHPGAMIMREDFNDYIDEEDFLKGDI